jgi:hypothetical protein
MSRIQEASEAGMYDMEEDDSGLIEKPHNDNITLTSLIQELEDQLTYVQQEHILRYQGNDVVPIVFYSRVCEERDKWKEEAECSDGIIEKLRFRNSRENRVGHGGTDVISLDHDLCGERYVDQSRKDCGMEVVRFLEQNPIPQGKIICHSYNTKARVEMRKRLSILPHVQEAKQIPFALDEYEKEFLPPT